MVSPLYVDRTEHMELLEEALFGDASKSTPRVVVLHGDGGVGKSELALKFALQHRQTQVAMLQFTPLGRN